MFKLLVFLCAGMFATMYVLGRDGGPVRDGLAGKVPPLMAPADTAKAPARRAALVAPAPVEVDQALVAEALASGPTPAPAAAQGGVIEAAFPVSGPAAAPPADGQASGGLTLALPLVDAGAPPPAAQAEIAAVPTGDPVAVVMYVTASAVNVRQGPSADTEALARLPRGEAVLATPSETPGWTRIVIEGDGVEGFVASRFLGGPTDGGLFNEVD